jgi:hypothetical protein
MQKVMFLVALCLCLTSCATPNWQKYGATKAELRRDGYECERDVRSIGGGVGDQISMYARCMESKGWQQNGWK